MLICNVNTLYSLKKADTLLSPSHRDKLQPQSRPTLRDLQTKSSTNTTSTSTPSPVLAFPSEQPGSLLDSLPSLGPPTPAPQNDISLANVTVPLESIKPSKPIV